ncbi:MAG: hypothetical protein ABJ275_03710 [Maricaulaceae bacterium]
MISKHKYWLGLTIILAGCNSSEVSADGLIIENLKTGLVCPLPLWNNIEPEKYKTNICHETSTIMITGQGICTYKNEQRPCTWYGFEFDYKNAKPNHKLSCISKTEYTADFGNPEKIVAEDVNQINFELKLDDKNGHFFNPQYTVFNRVSKANSIETHEISCFDGSSEVFKIKERLIYPVKLDE